MNTLTVLGGANVDGSCYIAEINGVRMMFDCGAKPGAKYNENIDIPSPETIDIIFISHAHLDHIGAIAYAASVCKNAKIYASPMTAFFLSYQLSSTIAGYIGANTEALRYHNKLLCNMIMNRIENVEFREKHEHTTASGEKCLFTFFQAGHMPGASMIYVQVDNRTILYTGDFTSRETPLTGGYDLPDNLNVDTLLVCGLHANEPEFSLSQKSIGNPIQRKIMNLLTTGPKIIIPTTQLTKGIELIEMIKDLIERNVIYDSCTVYLGKNLMNLAREFERRSSIFTLPPFIKSLSDRSVSNHGNEKEIVIGEYQEIKPVFKKYGQLNPMFTLHEDYGGLVSLINKLKPNNVFVVHINHRVDNPCIYNDDSIDSRISIYAPKNGECCLLTKGDQ